MAATAKPGLGRREWLFDVLDLFFEAVDLALYVDDAACDIVIAGLGGDGVRLSEHFLADEFEPSPGAAVSGAGPDEFFEMKAEAGELF